MSKITIETNNSVSTHRMNSYFDDIRLINMPLLESMLTMRTIFIYLSPPRTGCISYREKECRHESEREKSASLKT